MSEEKLVRLPGSVLTPTVAMHRVLQRVDELEAVAVIWKDKEGFLDATWSQMKAVDFAALAFYLNGCAQNVIVPCNQHEDEAEK